MYHRKLMGKCMRYKNSILFVYTLFFFHVGDNVLQKG